MHPDASPIRTYQESSRYCREATEARQQAMWLRFLVLWDPKVDGECKGVDLVEWKDRRAAMVAAIRADKPRAWYFVSWLEAHDLLLDHKFTRRPADEPCPHLPGSRGRIETLERRLATGQELFHPLDRTGAEDLNEMFGDGAAAALTRHDSGGERDPIKVPRFRRKKQER